jgi:hypothetical protein
MYLATVFARPSERADYVEFETYAKRSQKLHSISRCVPEGWIVGNITLEPVPETSMLHTLGTVQQREDVLLDSILLDVNASAPVKLVGKYQTFVEINEEPCEIIILHVQSDELRCEGWYGKDGTYASLGLAIDSYTKD